MSGDRIEADVCIVGAGPAGIAVALQLLDSGLQVVVIEGGGFGFDASAQEAARGTVASPSYASDALAAGRRRQFGGTANLWIYSSMPDDGRRYARALPPEPLDLERRAGPETSGWPLEATEMAPYHQRANRLWNGGPFDYDLDTWWNGPPSPLRMTTAGLVTRVAQHGPGDVFSLRYRDALVHAEGVRVIPRTTAVELVAGPDSGVTGVDAVDARSGQRVEIRARTTVVACGGVENARLLLASPIGHPGGVANPHDNVGRYLTDHPEFRMATIDLAAGLTAGEFAEYDLRWAGTALVSHFLTLPEVEKREDGLLNVSGALVAQGPGFGTAGHRSIELALDALAQRSPRRLAASALGVARHPIHATQVMRTRLDGRRFQEFSGGWSTSRRRFTTFEVHAATEQTPLRGNRICLAADRDEFGRRRARLEWDWSEADRRNVARSIRRIGEAIERAKVGRFRSAIDLLATLDSFGGLHHPMGTTRIDSEPRLGVVDETCRVHGTENLYLAGSSVFPTGHGYANPTLTILALAIRLGDHLRATLRP